MKLSSPDVNNILKLAKSSNYQLACQKHFDVTHPDHLKMDLGAGDGGAVSNHPNMWYQTSVKYHQVKKGGAGRGASGGKDDTAGVKSAGAGEEESAEMGGGMDVVE